MQRRVFRIGFEQLKGTIGLIADFSGQVVVASPKVW
jgi:hypothetical protein